MRRSRTGRVQLPTYVAPNWPTPDVPGGAITPPGFTSYPQTLIRSAPTPMESNPVWQELNKRVGATLNVSLTPFADYGAKVPTILAGNDLPDMLFLPNGFPVPGFPQFLEARCADLTPFLSGDAVKNYPNLAAHPTSVWKTVVINNKIFGVGDPIPPYFWVHWHHAELLQQAGLSLPKTGADYKSMLNEAVGVQDPTVGFYSETAGRQGVVANQRFGDGITDIVAGRRPRPTSIHSSATGAAAAATRCGRSISTRWRRPVSPSGRRWSCRR